MARNWTWEDYDVIRTQYPEIGTKITKLFPGSSMETIRTRALRINTCAPVPFSEEELELAKRYGSTLGSALIFLLPNRSPGEIQKLIQ